MILSAVDNIFFGQLFPNTRPSSSREWTTFELQTWKSIKIPISKNPHLVRITIYLRYDVIGNSSVAQLARRISSLSIPGIYILKQRKFYQSFPLVSRLCFERFISSRPICQVFKDSKQTSRQRRGADVPISSSRPSDVIEYTIKQTEEWQHEIITLTSASTNSIAPFSLIHP